ncbi:uncharacterized protein LOC110898626 [Helianthus annuus]|uniref:uncharacterized protein LOC110898626 n=1 Tax=Helianthus annuus TaxID=4232 RepID=UPI000B900740|nr:uncharacterized protein LOC110898626 [Helianthus annuus]
MEDRELEEDEQWVWAECKHGIEKLENFYIRDLKQRSRIKWASLGDNNTKFFQSVINKRRSSNAIQGLMIYGEWVSEPNVVKREVLRHFSKLFKEQINNQSGIICDRLKRILNDLVGGLISLFTKEEIKRAVFDCGSEKATGPNGVISYGCSSAFITLIPKLRNPVGLKDFRPITLVDIINKVISKVLAARLKKVIGLAEKKEESGVFNKGGFRKGIRRR